MAETGIDNCVTVSASVAGTVASWTITGQLNTVDHFSVFASQDGANLMWLADSPAAATSLDIAKFGLNAGNYTIFVKAVGKPSLTNKMSGGVQVTLLNQPPVAALNLSGPPGAAPFPGPLTAAGERLPLQRLDQRTWTAPLWPAQLILAMAAPR